MPCDMAPFRGRWDCRPGHSCDRTSVRLRRHTRPNGCSMSRVFGRTVAEVRVTLAVTPSGIAVVLDRAVGIRRNATRATIERVARIALEGSRKPRAKQPGTGHGTLAVPATDGIGRLDGAAVSRLDLLEQAELLTLAEARSGDTEQSDADAANFGSRKLERRPEDGLGKVGRLGQRP